MKKFLLLCISMAMLVLFVEFILSLFFDIVDPVSILTLLIVVSSYAIVFTIDVFTKNSKKERKMIND